MWSVKDGRLGHETNKEGKNKTSALVQNFRNVTANITFGALTTKMDRKPKT